MAELLLPRFGGDFQRKELSESTSFVSAGTGNLKPVIRHNGHVSLTDGDFQRSTDPVRLISIGLGDNPGFANDSGEFAGAAISDRGFIGVEFNKSVGDANTSQGSKDMLDGMNLDRPSAQSGGALSIGDQVDLGFQFRSAFQVDAAKAQAGIGRGGQQGELDPVTRVKTNSGVRDRLFER